MINLEDKAIAHLLAHKGVQLSHLESQQIEILSHELSYAHCKLLQYNTIQYNILYFERVDIHD